MTSTPPSTRPATPTPESEDLTQSMTDLHPDEWITLQMISDSDKSESKRNTEKRKKQKKPRWRHTKEKQKQKNLGGRKSYLPCPDTLKNIVGVTSMKQKSRYFIFI